MTAFGYPVHRPADLPDMRLWLMNLWREGNLYYEVQSRVQEGNKAAGWKMEFVSNDRVFDTEALPEARLYYVTADMARLIDSASRSLPATTLTPELVPCPAGLIFYEEPLSGMAAQLESPFATKERMAEALSVRMVLWGTAVIPVGREVIGISTYAESSDILSPCGRTDWVWGQDSDEPTDDEILELGEQERRMASMAEDRRWLATFWLLLSQGGVASEVEHRSPRAVMRRSERAKLGSLVRVVDVRQPRRAAPETDEPKKVDWSHRWIVEGFWRQQAYGPKHSLRRPQYIAPFVKGPPGLPLVLKDTVHVLRGD